MALELKIKKYFERTVGIIEYPSSTLSPNDGGIKKNV